MITAREKQFTVNKERLIAQLKENLLKHVADYEEAKVGYRLKLKADFEKALEWFDEQPYDHIEKLEVRSTPPRSYAKEFEAAIRRCEWSEGDTIQLDDSTFRQYIENEWSWTSGFDLANNTYKAYASGAIGG